MINNNKKENKMKPFTKEENNYLLELLNEDGIEEMLCEEIDRYVKKTCKDREDLWKKYTEGLERKRGIK
jgi:hypothetical protein